ncbi:MAG: S41 family peptidase [Candidatus Gastranaerophilales bacterium]|nr:S41 family peptidase [Candidatus Gastranaerophilales bacterium]
MKNTKYSIYITIITILLSLSIYGCGFKESHQPQQPVKNVLSSVGSFRKSPQGIFLKSWKVIKNEYLDETFNHQDWEKWKDRYYDRIKTKEDAYVAIETMLESLNDPYTRFLRPSDFDEQDRNIDARLFGIGVHIATKNNRTVIVHVIEGTPALKAGLKAGDIILKVNNISTKGLDIKQVADIVRGKAGTKVALELQRNKSHIYKDILRKEINIKSVEYKILDNKYAYIHILSFISNDTSIETAQALEKTKNAKGIIIDLRGNYGGLLPNAVFIANMFIKKGAIVSIVDKSGYKETINAAPYDIYTSKPVIVLINQASASASEILSGALKDHKRAILVGEKSFGKGLVQKIISLPDGSGLNITIAKYLTPNGTDINKKGIQPDYKVKITEKDFIKHYDPQLAKAKQVLAQEINNKLETAYSAK